LVEVQGLFRDHEGRPALVDVSFSVARGQAVGLVGPAGSGKSTVLRILAGLLAPTAGTVTIAGHDAGTRDARRHAGYLAAGAPLFGEMRVESYLRLMCRLRGVPPGRMDDALERCGLADHRREVVGRLAAGLRRRVGLAQAVVHDPDVLLLDEPGGDPEVIAELGRGRAVVLSGRGPADVGGMCDRVLVLEAGRVVADEAPADLRARPVLEVTVVFRGDAATAKDHVERLAGVSAVAVEDLDAGAHRLTVTGDRDDLQDAVARVIVEHRLRLEQLSSRRPPANGAG
jgi:ABC-2 type transport system ATP-binding protein